jgi:hypothetical protein
MEQNMIHYGQILKPAWHESATVRHILAQFAAHGFPAFDVVPRQGIWSDTRAQEYDRTHPGVAALMTARAIWFELVGACRGPGADELIRRHQQRCAWEADFLATIAAMALDFPPHGNEASKAARTGDVRACPVAAARGFVANWERARLDSISRYHAAHAGQAAMAAKP